MHSTSARVAAEFAGTMLLLTVIVGSGIMGERLSGGNDAIALLANSFATGLGLFVLILVFAPLSGAHFNPLVTMTSLVEREIVSTVACVYVLAQLGGAVAGVTLAHAMFELPAWLPSSRVRTGAGQWLAETVATFGLGVTIAGTRRYGVVAMAAAVAAYIAAAYWFTASTSFANPAVTIARSLTPTFSGIAPSGIPGFVIAQCAGALLAWAFAYGLHFGKR